MTQSKDTDKPFIGALTKQGDSAETAILRRLCGGRQKLLVSHFPLARELQAQGLITQGDGSEAFALTDAGSDALVAADGPLTDLELAYWVDAGGGKTRIGKDGGPQKLLQRGWTRFRAPRARFLMNKWEREEERRDYWEARRSR